MDTEHMSTLWHIFHHAVEHAEKCTENESPHSASEWMSVARDADHIIRKHEEIEEDSHSPTQMRTR